MSASRIVVLVVAAFLIGVLAYAVAFRSERTFSLAPGKQTSGDKEARVVASDTKAEKVIDYLKISVEIPSNSIKLGELLHFNISVENVGSKPRELVFNSSQKFDIRIEDKTGATVWTWSDGRMFAQMIEEVTLEPHETTSFTAMWPMQDKQGNTVQPGNYKAFAKVVANGVKDKDVELGFTLKADD
ncbi:MAG: hypothetical protein COW32_11200 [Candidatus Aquicultor secundus]|uniref:Intracellular proteinase inhibitor BsuPI domain-containing protein n=1 Tax=Candidatus Aquicultor secundus TaxID=1973895 RepID=A0A2M7TAG1_9ACTN|nr:BsuPI-related putative proteinase inhibitor [Candidatus Aquicultor secundus]NCO66513.1 DUF3821 domain-containing protein [Solirubrobacter sp.]OIO88046.1 MAG: hypothetical protein AUK32_02390 [Candidatus Aquicultor secundus]PIU26562.1 MAG: hypothetical protein COT10_08015 [Candidatus Aquicultor secundus]PIW21198.1 MAG: hypothetical protein COW32_11200 [Candidatus Aquicultor secundus]PIX51969.1 MAG: hypothetical protein COZ51_06745 [Candidatus Aquicultor secundus]